MYKSNYFSLYALHNKAGKFSKSSILPSNFPAFLRAESAYHLDFYGVVYIMMKDFFNGLVSARMMELDSSRSFAKARKAERTAK